MSGKQLLRGSCLCGRVKYEVTTRIKRFYFCHCDQCRKLTGSAHASNILTVPAPVRWLRGERYLRRYDDEGGRAFTHVFCRECGSGLPFTNIGVTTLIIPAGSLDHDIKATVDRNIFWSEAPAWYPTGIAAPRDGGFPE